MTSSRGPWPPAYHPTRHVPHACRYLKQQLAKHGVQTLVPESEVDLSQIFQLIMDELGFNIFKDDTRAFFVAQVKLCSGVLCLAARQRSGQRPLLQAGTRTVSGRGVLGGGSSQHLRWGATAPIRRPHTPRRTYPG